MIHPTDYSFQSHHQQNFTHLQHLNAKIYSIAKCYTDSTTHNEFPILRKLHSTGIIKNDLIYNILPVCQCWSWQSTFPGLLSMARRHPVCKPACQLVQDCPIQFDLLQHLMSDHGYLSVRDYKQTNTKMFHWISYLHTTQGLWHERYWIFLGHLSLVKTYRAESRISEWWRMVDEQFQNAATWTSLSIY